MIERIIPSSGESVPVIGMGTWQAFDVNVAGDARDALTVWADGGGRLIDTSPMYGRAEAVIGQLTADPVLGGAGLGDRLFYATKVWTRGKQEGIRQMEDSFRKLRRAVIDLMQIHNLVDWQVHLPQLRQWKEEGRIRYIGITHYRSNHHEDLAAIIRSEPIDFVQFNYSLFDRHAEEMILPLAQERGVATLVNRPFGEGGFLKHLIGRPLPGWAGHYGMEDWASFILKYIISHPVVTCVIPATRDVAHAHGNATAGVGFLPDEALRKKMADYIKGI